MYFNASERIALKTTFSRSQIEKVDDFLAGMYVNRFELRQVREKTGLNDNISEILDEYVKSRVLKKEVVNICPIHGIVLDRINRNEGFCIECDYLHAYEDCPKKTIYERKRKPDRQKKVENTQATEPTSKTRPWWRKRENLEIAGLFLALLAAIFGFIQIIPILFPSGSSENNMVDSSITQPIELTTIESDIESLFTPIPQTTQELEFVTPVASQSPETNVQHTDITPEITPEPIPTKDPDDI